MNHSRNNDAIKIEFQILKKAIDILKKRLNKVENLIQKYDLKYFGVIIFFRGNFNKTNK
jgi:hypothetical protein